MQKKDYYALNDVPKRFDVNLPTIKKLIDQKRITPVFNLPPTRLVIGGINKDRFFVGYGTGVYQGLIAIQRSQFSELWHENKVESNFLILLNTENITDYSDVNPFTVRLPSGLIQSWQPTPLTDITRNRVIAVCMPEYDSFYFPKSFIFADPELCENADIQNSPDHEEVQIHSWLKETKLKLKLSETIILHSDLISSGAIPPPLEQSKPSAITSPNVGVIKTSRFANPFHELISKILTKHPDFSVKKIFRILASEAHSDIDEREFDTDNVLADEIDGVLFWNDVTRKTGLAKCSHRTLKNPVREVKIVMKEKSDQTQSNPRY